MTRSSRKLSSRIVTYTKSISLRRTGQSQHTCISYMPCVHDFVLFKGHRRPTRREKEMSVWRRERERERRQHTSATEDRVVKREREELRGGEISLRAGARSRAEHKGSLSYRSTTKASSRIERDSPQLHHAPHSPRYRTARPASSTTSPSAACTRRAHREAAADDSRTEAVPGRGTNTPPSQHRRASVASPGQHRQRQRERRQRRNLHSTY